MNWKFKSKVIAGYDTSLPYKLWKFLATFTDKPVNVASWKIRRKRHNLLFFQQFT